MRKLASASCSFVIGLGFSASAHAQTTGAQATGNVAADSNAAGAGGSASANANVATPPPTTTNDSSDNALQLRDGSYLRGRVTDMRPGQYVIVVNPGGQRTVAWSDIMHAEGPSFPGGYNTTMYVATPGVAPVVAPPDYLHPQPGRVPLVVESAGPVFEVGESFTTGFGQGGYGLVSRPMGRAVCTTPCTLYVDPSTFALQARAHGYRTATANVTVPSSGLRVRMNATSNGRFFGSIGLMGGGGLVAVTGLSVMLYGATLNTAYSSGYYGSTPRMIGDGFVAGGAVVTGIGVAAIVAGAIWLGTSHSGVESSSPLPAGGAATQPNVTIGPLSEGGVMSSVTGRF